jgi:hypothetical protein
MYTTEMWEELCNRWFINNAFNCSLSMLVRTKTKHSRYNVTRNIRSNYFTNKTSAVISWFLNTAIHKSVSGSPPFEKTVFHVWKWRTSARRRHEGNLLFACSLTYRVPKESPDIHGARDVVSPSTIPPLTISSPNSNTPEHIHWFCESVLWSGPSVPLSAH